MRKASQLYCQHIIVSTLPTALCLLRALLHGLGLMIRALPERSGDIEIVGEAGDGVQALQAIATLAPDVVVLDIFMAHMDGFAVLKALRQMQSRPKVVMLSMNDSAETVQRALASGASAFVSKKMAHSQLAKAVRAAATP